MEQLKQKIRLYGVILNDQTVALDAVLTQQVDPLLIMEAGREFAARFRGNRVTKVVTVESSGISLAFATAHELGVPLVFARRKKTLMSAKETYVERVPSFTKGIVTDILVNKDLLQPDDRVLIIDDIIANGDAARGLIRIIRRSGATLVGMGVAVEKSFQLGARTIREEGVRLESLVRIVSLADGKMVLE